MRKLFFSLLACLSASMAIAQNPSLAGGLYKHVIDVEAYKDWGKGYLTIIDNHCVMIEGIRYLTAFEPIIDSETAPRHPETGQIVFLDETIPDNGNLIYEVNGQSTLNMTPDEFYAITDTASVFTLQYEDNDRNIVTYSFAKYTEWANIVYSFAWPNWTSDNDQYEAGLPKFMISQNRAFSRLYNRQQDCGSAVSEVSDENFDFHNVRTFDYQITGDDPLNDKKILDEIPKGNWIRDTRKPDIIFTIKKNKDGNNIHMELFALDAKRLNTKKKNAALPIVWQMTVDRERRKNENIIEAYIDYAGWAGLPIDDRFCSQAYELYKTSGIEMKNRIVTKVHNSLCTFLTPGDEIIKIEVFENRQVRQRNTNNSWSDINNKKVLKNKEITTYNLDRAICFTPHLANMYLTDKWDYRNVNDYIVITYKSGKKKLKHTIRPQPTVAERWYLCNKEQLSNLKY